MSTTVIGDRMSHWKWRETKLHPSRARSGNQISYCLVSLHFLCDILAPITVDEQVFCGRSFFVKIGNMILLRRAWMDWSIKMAIAIWVADVPIWQLGQTAGRIR